MFDITDLGVRRLKELKATKDLDLQTKIEREVLLELFNCGETGYLYNPWEVEKKIKTLDMPYMEARRRVNTALRNLVYAGYAEGDFEEGR